MSIRDTDLMVGLCRVGVERKLKPSRPEGLPQQPDCLRAAKEAHRKFLRCE